MTTIPYTVVPQVTEYNVAVFFINYGRDSKGVTLRDAFFAVFEIAFREDATFEETVRWIMELT